MLNPLTRLALAPNGCWLWTGPLTADGYGRSGRLGLAHRAVYTILVGPIPEGLDLDHRCHSTDLSCSGGRSCPHRACCNPTHLQPSTRRDNLAAGRGFTARNIAATHCPVGHPYDEANTRVYLRSHGPVRACLTCKRASARRYRANRALREAS